MLARRLVKNIKICEYSRPTEKQCKEERFTILRVILAYLPSCNFRGMAANQIFLIVPNVLNLEELDQSQAAICSKCSECLTMFQMFRSRRRGLARLPPSFWQNKKRHSSRKCCQTKTNKKRKTSLRLIGVAKH